MRACGEKKIEMELDFFYYIQKNRKEGENTRTELYSSFVLETLEIQ